MLADKALFFLNSLCPKPLPPAVEALTHAHAHHLLVTVGDFGGGERARFHERLATLRANSASAVSVHTCSPDEAQAVNYFRFAAAPAFRTWCIGRGLEGVSVDYALPKAATGAPLLAEGITALRMRYSPTRIPFVPFLSWTTTLFDRSVTVIRTSAATCSTRI